MLSLLSTMTLPIVVKHLIDNILVKETVDTTGRKKNQY